MDPRLGPTKPPTLNVSQTWKSLLKTQAWPLIKDLSNVSSNQLGRPSKQAAQRLLLTPIFSLHSILGTKIYTQELGHSAQFKGNKGCHFPTYYFSF